MRFFMKGLFFLICCFSVMDLSAKHMNSGFCNLECQNKIYFDANNLEIFGNIIYINMEEDNWIETSAIRTDQQGLYIFESDIINCAVKREKKWKCPYCFLRWPMGEKCQNPECPTNQW